MYMSDKPRFPASHNSTKGAAIQPLQTAVFNEAGAGIPI